MSKTSLSRINPTSPPPHTSTQLYTQPPTRSSTQKKKNPKNQPNNPRIQQPPQPTPWKIQPEPGLPSNPSIAPGSFPIFPKLHRQNDLRRPCTFLVLASVHHFTSSTLDIHTHPNTPQNPPSSSSYPHPQTPNLNTKNHSTKPTLIEPIGCKASSAAER